MIGVSPWVKELKTELVNKNEIKKKKKNDLYFKRRSPEL